MNINSIQNVIDKVQKANKIVVLTGAGISTASGIPDFRGSQGLYTKYPNDVLSINSFKSNTAFFYEAFQDKFSKVFEATPNRAHDILSKWERDGKVLGIITQNVDRLHQKSGSKNVIEYHGSIWKYVKLDKNWNTVELDIDFESIVDETGKINYTEGDFIYKPDVVLFGEDVRGHNDAANMVAEADLILILGTKMAVYPFANLPSYNNKRDTSVIVVNQDKLSSYIYGKVHLYEDIVEVLELIDENL